MRSNRRKSGRRRWQWSAYQSCLHRITRLVVVHHLHHLVLQLRLGVRILFTELLQNKLLGERPGDGEPEELLQDERLVLGTAHPPLLQVSPVRVLQHKDSHSIQSVRRWMIEKPLECIRAGSPELSIQNPAVLQ